MTSLPEKVLSISAALAAHGVPHAFGGALALAWCTQRARGTIDVDLNAFVAVHDVDRVLRALPEVVPDDAARRALLDEGQARLWWDRTPVDLFLNTTPFHEQASTRVVRHDFGGVAVPFLSCSDLAVFKAFSARTKDWADLEEMAAAGTLDLERVVGVLVLHLGADDERIARLVQLRPQG